MKNIVLIGASRAGKSTLTKLLEKRFNNLMIIRTDLLRLAFRDAICKDLTINTSLLKYNDDYINYILSYYNYANMYDVDYIKIVDTVDFEPKDYHLFENSIMICLGYPNITVDEVIKNWRKYDTDLDWTKNKSDSSLASFAKNGIDNSKYLKQECEKYGVKFVDTSYSRNTVLDELTESVERLIKGY